MAKQKQPKLIELSCEEWEAKYKPLPNTTTPREEWNGWMYETYGADETSIQLLNHIEPNRIWTVLTGLETGDTIAQGYHHVNQLCYFVTELPFNPEDETYVLLEGTKERGITPDQHKLVPEFAKRMLFVLEDEMDEDDAENIKTLIDQYESGQNKDIEYLFVPLVQTVDSINHFDTEWNEFLKSHKK